MWKAKHAMCHARPARALAAWSGPCDCGADAEGGGMFFGPLGLPLSWLLGLLSLALLGGGVYLVWAWYVGVLVGTGWLLAGAAMTAWTFAGRFVVLLFRRPGQDEPARVQPEAVIR